MNLLNATAMPAAWTMGIDPSGREHVVVVAKGTFLIPERRRAGHAGAQDQQAPLVMADTFTGEPGRSAPVHEAEFAWAKPRCDVLVNATAYAPEGRPAERVRVGVKLGGWRKVIDVVGDRVWIQRGATPAPSAPRPFTTMPVTYDRAFGGMDDTDPEHASAYMRNPIGRGYGAPRSAERLLGRPVANTEDPRDPVLLPWGDYAPMGLGPVARGWQPRLALAGTYDQHWLDEVFPFLPADFDDAPLPGGAGGPADRRAGGGEEVVLLNLTPAGRVRFRLPTDLEVPVVFFPKRGEVEQRRATLDTVLIEPDHGTLCLVWRCTRPLRRNVFELAEVLVGRASRAWWRAQDSGQDVPPEPRRPCPPPSARGRRGMSRAPLLILGCGMTTAVGLTAPASCAAIRARLDGFRETRFMARGGAWIVGAEVPLEEPWRGLPRLARLVAGPIRECLDLAPELAPEDIPLLLGVAETDPARPPRRPRPGTPAHGAGACWRSGSTRRSRPVPMGRVSGAVGIREAAQLINEQGFQRVIVAGVDSYLVAATLALLRRARPAADGAQFERLHPRRSGRGRARRPRRRRARPPHPLARPRRRARDDRERGAAARRGPRGRVQAGARRRRPRPARDRLPHRRPQRRAVLVQGGGLARAARPARAAASSRTSGTRPTASARSAPRRAVLPRRRLWAAAQGLRAGDPVLWLRPATTTAGGSTMVLDGAKAA